MHTSMQKKTSDVVYQYVCNEWSQLLRLKFLVRTKFVDTLWMCDLIVVRIIYCFKYVLYLFTNYQRYERISSKCVFLFCFVLIHTWSHLCTTNYCNNYYRIADIFLFSSSSWREALWHVKNNMHFRSTQEYSFFINLFLENSTKYHAPYFL